MKFLENDILKLRAVEPDDATAMWEIESDSTQWLDNGMSAPYSRHNLREYSETYDADPIRAGQLRLIVELKGENNPIIGIADLYDISPIGRTAFVGIYIKEEYRCKGYGRTSLLLLEQYSSRLLNLRILGAKVSDNNKSSLQMFESICYQKCGILKDWLQFGKNTHSIILFTKDISELS